MVISPLMWHCSYSTCNPSNILQAVMMTTSTCDSKFGEFLEQSAQHIQDEHSNQVYPGPVKVHYDLNSVSLSAGSQPTSRNINLMMMAG